MPVIGDEIGLTLDEIVVATDFSPVSEAAVAYAVALAKRFASRLTVANVVDLSVATKSEEAVVGIPIEKSREDSVNGVENLLNDLTLKGIHARGRSLEAHSPAAELVRLADEVKANLLVLGTHAKSGLKRMILGSCAEAVIHHAHCPVFTVGPNVKEVPAEGIAFRTIVFATDLESESVHRSALALAFAKDSLAHIYMCYVINDAPSALTESLDRQFAAEKHLSEFVPATAFEWCSPECCVEYGDAATHIVQLAEAKNADLIVMGARRNGSWFTHPSEGTVARVLAEAKCPVMNVCAA